jgi:hypothetical protein
VKVAIEVPEVAFKGPHDTDAKFFAQVADRLEGNEYVGGSNVRSAVAKLLRNVVTELENAEALFEEKDLRFDVYTDGSIVKPLASVKITHVPTGTVVTRHGRSQLMAKVAAIEALREALRSRADD